eukprot:CAMPEP_0181212540 /NCGR_PEP_ID=MMETSP1096-20121128/24405_1 /TAXON_ID=156174 ORGANISM="Chrysochromulina ericina, Strain CCMP281" /NCGR_SAMPLE_ID=MMETSP1096 /ASSEMBLY_ACC=CAM_ASM_000453 /LENGTH=56 /DNA_ID=CAMNT_0023304077 /DNA_START=307 /DNA_END=477 /DNA_ORIENTATION=-
MAEFKFDFGKITKPLTATWDKITKKDKLKQIEKEIEKEAKVVKKSCMSCFENCAKK